MKQAIVVDTLGKRFGSKAALSGVSFAVNEGSIFGFLGPNGAGKSTTIRCLMDLVRPDSGSVMVLGLNSRVQAVEVRRQVGYLPADAPLYGHWTGQQHIDFVAATRGIVPDRKLLNELEFDPKPRAKYLSTGNRQKLAIILAFMAKPKLLVLDEPTRGLDPLAQNQLYAMLRKFRDDGGTVFMSSHNLGEVEKICDTVTVIKDGRVVVEETLDSIKHKSIYHVTASFNSPVDPRRFKVSHVEVVHSTPTSVNLRVHGDINPLMHIFAHSKLKDLEITRASLDEIFMEYYQ